jgi:DNA-directed RNA polymerase subunit RPC12/RpoP
MSTHPHGPSNPAFREPFENQPLVCGHCSTDRNLALHSIETLNPPSEVLVKVGYSCTACGRHYLHQADVASVAAVLNRNGSLTNVLAFGGHYIHCGQPMEKTGSELRRLSAPAFTDSIQEETLDVYMTTRVLRCRCGFQMELPE